MTIFTTTASFIRRLRYSTNIDPARDWLIVLTCSTILLVGVIVWNVWAFDTVANGKAIGATPTATPSFNQASLDAIRAVFENRADEEANYVTGVYRYADPSQ